VAATVIGGVVEYGSQESKSAISTSQKVPNNMFYQGASPMSDGVKSNTSAQINNTRNFYGPQNFMPEIAESIMSDEEND
jgi:hypothetical protein